MNGVTEHPSWSCARKLTYMKVGDYIFNLYMKDFIHFFLYLMMYYFMYVSELNIQEDFKRYPKTKCPSSTDQNSQEITKF